MKKRKTFKFTLFNKPWKALIISEEKADVLFGNKTLAETVSEEKTIYFRPSPTIETVRHELLHAYYNALPLWSATLKVKQVEEIFSDLIGDYWDDFSKHTKQIHKWSKNE